MRDPKRVNKILKRVEAVWKKTPQLRLAQLILNLEHITERPLYHLEDDELAEALEEMYKAN